MHMADALLSPAVGGAMWAISAGLIGYSVHKIRQNFDESRIPLMGVTGAFVFAMQMINFAIPGTGSSGHIAGAVLLSALLGSCPAFIVMASVILIQALFFADGGILAYGGNLFNMGFFGCFLAYPYVFKPILGKSGSPVRLAIASCAACIVSMTLGALSVTIMTLVSGVTELPFKVFAAAMIPIHVAIGFGEGLATMVVLEFVRKNLPDFQDSKLESPGFSFRNLCWVFALAALVIGGGISLLASGDPDGLEWSMEKVAQTTELEAPESQLHQLSETITERCSFLPDYEIPGTDGAWYGTVVSGIVGVLILIVGGMLFYRKKKPAEAK